MGFNMQSLTRYCWVKQRIGIYMYSNIFIPDRFILMLTDGKPTDTNIDEIYTTIQQGNAALNNSVIIFTYGLGPG